jgi:hypothetical protein
MTNNTQTIKHKKQANKQNEKYQIKNKQTRDLK